MVDMSIVLQFYIPIHSKISTIIGIQVWEIVYYLVILANQVNFVLVTPLILFETDL